MFNFAIENDWLVKNPFHKKKGVISKAAENERDRVLTHKEEKRLLANCTGKRSHIKPITICALDTGMRRGEIFKMEWKHVNFETGEIYIPETNTKTQTERTLGMTSRLKKELENLWESSPKVLDMTVFGIKSTIKNAFFAPIRQHPNRSNILFQRFTPAICSKHPVEMFRVFSDLTIYIHIFCSCR